MRVILVMLAFSALAGCANQYKPLPMVKADDPVFRLNADRWQANVNDLLTPPGDGAPHSLPSPVPTGSSEVPTL